MPINNVKTEIIIPLREHLKSKYQTKYVKTYSERQRVNPIEEIYFLMNGEDNTRYLSGFCFQRNLCLQEPRNNQKILQDILGFLAENKNLETKLKEDELTIDFEDKKYLIFPHIEKDYLGKISIDFIELPMNFKTE